MIRNRKKLTPITKTNTKKALISNLKNFNKIDQSNLQNFYDKLEKIVVQSIPTINDSNNKKSSLLQDKF